MRSTKRWLPPEAWFGSAARLACCKVAWPISSHGISPRTRKLASHSKRPIAAWMSSMTQSISRFGSDCRHSRIRDLAMRSFGGSQMILVGSPALVAAHGQPRALTDIERMPTLSMGTAGKEHSWRFLDTDSKSVELVHSPRLSTDDLYTLRQAAICGVGVACLPALLVADDLSGGALVRLLPSLSSQSGVVHAIFPSRRGMVPAVRSLLDSLSQGFAANPWLVCDE